MNTSKDIQTLAYKAFEKLPSKLNQSNISLFSKACEYVDDLCSNPDLYRLLMPFHHLTFGWQSAYGEGFTWYKFLQDIIDDSCTEVSLMEMHGDSGPAIWFRKNNDVSLYDYRIAVVHDD